MRRVIIRTHGGLGNQIFQVFFALVRYQKNIILNHDKRYPHGFQLAHCFQEHFCDATSVFESLICRSRVVKLLEKSSAAIPEIKLGNSVFLDGYFQKVGFYAPYDGARLLFGLNCLRDILEINGRPTKNYLSHLRLADFFNSDFERVTAARKRLECMGGEINFISSDDALISNDQQCQDIISRKSLMHIKTDGYSAEKIFRLMSEYQTIESNNSTLAFWAAVLNKTELRVDDANLKKMFFLLKNL